MRLDLHCHSTCSDGSRPAAEVAALAAARGVELFCLTDHDTWSGWAATRAVASATCRVLGGVELSCRAFDRTVHVLALGLGEGEGLDALHLRLQQVQLNRRERVVAICGRLARLGAAVDPEAILLAAEGRTPGRPDVARALVAAGVCTSPKEAFTRFLRDGGPADVPVDRLEVGEAVALARAAGARLSLAHPHTLGHPSLVRDLFVRHRAEGLEGIEACYGPYAKAERTPWLRLAQELDLVVTAGSDFHGDMVPEVTTPGTELPGEHADRLREWLAA